MDNKYVVEFLCSLIAFVAPKSFFFIMANEHGINQEACGFCLFFFSVRLGGISHSDAFVAGTQQNNR